MKSHGLKRERLILSNKLWTERGLNPHPCRPDSTIFFPAMYYPCTIGPVPRLSEVSLICVRSTDRSCTFFLIFHDAIAVCPACRSNWEGLRLPRLTRQHLRTFQNCRQEPPRRLAKPNSAYENIIHHLPRPIASCHIFPFPACSNLSHYLKDHSTV
jgi:hypothetical protein